MADKNNNGIDDSKEYRPGQRTLAPRVGSANQSNRFAGTNDAKRAGVNPFFGALDQIPGVGLYTDAHRQVLNFLGDLTRSDSPQDRIGTGFGDQVMGVRPGYYGAKASSGRGGNPGDQLMGVADAVGRLGGLSQRGPKAPPSMSFLDALRMAAGMVPGANMIARVNYDPQREAARSQAAENDARLGAMYKQLSDSIAADAPAIQAAYQTAIDNTNAGGAAAQQSVQAANDAAGQRNQQVLANLGIGDAAQQIIAQGRDANTATANQQADMAASQAANAQNLQAAQTSAVQQNRSIGEASTLEGNLQRAQNAARLQSLLAQIGLQESNKNAEIDAQNAQAGQSGFAQAMQLANALYGSNRDELNQQNQLQLQAQKLAQSAGQPSKGQQKLDILGMLIQSGMIDPNTLQGTDLLNYLK